jgi:hypothetical protein
VRLVFDLVRGGSGLSSKGLSASTTVGVAIDLRGPRPSRMTDVAAGVAGLGVLTLGQKG